MQSIDLIEADVYEKAKDLVGGKIKCNDIIK